MAQLATGAAPTVAPSASPGRIATPVGRLDGDELTRTDGDRSPCRTCI